jgi:hypothetical protein
MKKERQEENRTMLNDMELVRSLFCNVHDERKGRTNGLLLMVPSERDS